jgi:rhodanese-related sulfurtransferase
MKFFLSLMLLIGSAHAYEDDIAADAAYKMQKAGEAIIVDVRTTIEYLYAGHGEGFINIPAYYWTYDEESIDARVKSAQYEVKQNKIKDHKSVLKLYAPKEVANKNFVKDVMKAMKLAGVEKVILVCRSGPRSSVAADLLAAKGITAFNLEDGFIFGWKDEGMPWGGQ